MRSTQSKWKVTFSNGMPYFFRIEGEIKVILWRRKASQLWALPGKKPGNTGNHPQHQWRWRSLVVFMYFMLNYMGHVSIIAVMVSEVLSIQYRGPLKAVLTSSLKPLSMRSWSDLWHPVVRSWVAIIWMIHFHRGLETNVMSACNTLKSTSGVLQEPITYPWQVVPVFSHALVGQHTWRATKVQIYHI